MGKERARIAHTPTTTKQKVGSLLKPIVNCKVPLSLRQTVLDKLIAKLGIDAVEVEEKLCLTCNSKSEYKLKSLSFLRPSKESESKPVVTDDDNIDSGMFENFILPVETLTKEGFPTEISEYEKIEKPKNRICDRCLRRFNPCEEMTTCRYHFGRTQYKGERRYTCCNEVIGSDPCVESDTHVFSIKDCKELDFQKSFGIGLPLLALDCEMVYTSLGLDLCRISIVDNSLSTVLDIIVRPEAPIIDYNTRFSGITEQYMQEFKSVLPKGLLEQCKIPPKTNFTFEEAFKLYSALIGENTVVVGHGLKNDLIAMRLIHTRIVDTSILYPHKSNSGFKRGLRELALRELNEFIQEGNGHDSIEDARISLRLARKYIQRNSNK